MKIILQIIACTALLTTVKGFSSFPSQIPNAGKVEHFGVVWTTLGHPQQGGSTNQNAANAFGKDVLAASNAGGEIWPQVCELDSDGDGFLNKIELCDPACAWRPGDPDPTECREDEVLGNTLGKPTHPGFADGNQAGGFNPALIHGIIMILSWLLLAPFAIVLAMTQKKKDTPRLDWFQFHKNIMLGAVGLTLIAYIVMLAGFGFTLESTHPKLGFVVVIFSLLQPISGFLRPHIEKGLPKSNKRLLWEFQHQWFGRIILFLATGSVITGIQVYSGVQEFGYAIAAIFALASLASFVYVIGFRDFESESKIIEDHVMSMRVGGPEKLETINKL